MLIKWITWTTGDLVVKIKLLSCSGCVTSRMLNGGCWGTSGRGFSTKLIPRLLQELVCYIVVGIPFKNKPNGRKFNGRDRGILILSNILKLAVSKKPWTSFTNQGKSQVIDNLDKFNPWHCTFNVSDHQCDHGVMLADDFFTYYKGFCIKKTLTTLLKRTLVFSLSCSISWSLLIQLTSVTKTRFIQTLLLVYKREIFHSFDPFYLFHLLCS